MNLNTVLNKELEIIKKNHLPFKLQELSNNIETIKFFHFKYESNRTDEIYIFHIHFTENYPVEMPQIFLVSPNIPFNPKFHLSKNRFSCISQVKIMKNSWNSDRNILDIWNSLRDWVSHYEKFS